MSDGVLGTPEVLLIAAPQTLSTRLAASPVSWRSEGQAQSRCEGYDCMIGKYFL